MGHSLTRAFVLFLVGFHFLALTGQGASRFISFQGRLTDPRGTPLSGVATVKFELYTAATGGIKIWPPPDKNELGIREVLPNDAGLFSTDIGPFEVGFFSHEASYFIQVSVDQFGMKPLLPRQELKSVPFAFHSDSADTAKRADFSQTIGNDSVDATKILDDSIETRHIQDSVITSEKIKSESITADHLLGSPVYRRHLAADVTSEFIPSGLIALFQSECPKGWTRFSDLDNRFPMGSDRPGEAGGSLEHSHRIDPDGMHDHRGKTDGAYPYARIVSGKVFESEYLHDAHALNKVWIRHQHTIPFEGTHAHGSDTQKTTLLPPHLTLTFCRRN